MTDQEDLYRIGTVAKITGVAVERLRAWERRHGLAPAHRSGRTRFYSESQVARLTTIKRLIDQGHPISSLADLDDEQLAGRLSTVRQSAHGSAHGSAPNIPSTGLTRAVGLVVPNLLVLEQTDGAASQLNILHRWANLESLEREGGSEALETVVVQLPVLTEQKVDRIQELCPNASVIALYQFATDGQVSIVKDTGVPVLQWPVGWPEIELACTSNSGLPLQAGRTAPRLYSDETLIAIAASIDADARPTPKHLVDMITHLNAFTEFSLQSAMEEGAEDDLHERTHTRAALARGQLELALESWIAADA